MCAADIIHYKSPFRGRGKEVARMEGGDASRGGGPEVESLARRGNSEIDGIRRGDHQQYTLITSTEHPVNSILETAQSVSLVEQ